MEVPPFARPNRASPSAWEADFLERTNLTMSTVEYALPTAIMTSPSFVAEGAGGSQICAMYSFQAFSEMINERNAITKITSEMTPTEFVAFSLETSRRDLIHQLSDVSHQEFRLKVLRSLQSVASALIRLHMLDKEMLEPHLSRPTLLGCKDDSPLNQDPYWPHFQVLSDEELSVEVRRGSLPMF
uniref:Uncharacterized protein n=1 Tax=Oryza glaberrima TaxID=4538 RepID=I1PI83_ORYGL